MNQALNIIRQAIDAEKAEWTGDYRKAAHVALEAAYEKIEERLTPAPSAPAVSDEQIMNLWDANRKWRHGYGQPEILEFARALLALSPQAGKREDA